MDAIFDLHRVLRIAAQAAFLFVATSAAAQPALSADVDALPDTPAPVVAPPWQALELGANGLYYRFPVYANRDLARDALRNITRVIIVVHGIERTADRYYATVEGLLATPELAARTLVIAPKFPSSIEPAIAAMPAWRKTAWADGGDSLRAVGRPAPISSFQVLDDLLRLFNNHQRLPALTAVVLAGHSAGGQLVHRYAMLNSFDTARTRGSVPLRYVVANPSSYLYPDLERPRTGSLSFAPYERGICPAYNQYPYGMDRLPPYANEQDRSRLWVRYAGRAVTYLLGQADHNPEQRFLDQDCAAEAQGATRLTRGLSYFHHEATLAAHSKPSVALAHSAYEVIGVGHDGAAMLSSSCGIQALLGEDAKVPAGASACRLIPPKAR